MRITYHELNDPPTFGKYDDIPCPVCGEQMEDERPDDPVETMICRPCGVAAYLHPIAWNMRGYQVRHAICATCGEEFTGYGELCGECNGALARDERRAEGD